MCCGTSLFFDYLVSNKLLKETDAVLKFVELTRQYDTWEWKHIYHNEEANELNLLFNILGREKYISMVLSHLKNADVFEFSKDEILLIENFKKEISDLCEKYVSAMKIKEIDGFVVGVIENVEHRCRNDISEVVKLKNIKLDYIAFTLKDRDTVSFRSIKKDVDVSVVAVKFGGKGHSNASSCPKSEIVNKYLFE